MDNCREISFDIWDSVERYQNIYRKISDIAKVLQ